MKKNKNGISLITLCITVVVLAIIAGVTINVATDLIDYAKLENLKTDLLLIQIKCKTKAEQANFKNDDNVLIGTSLKNININAQEYIQVKYLLDNNIINSQNITTHKIYLINQDNLNALVLDQIKLENKEFYIIEYGENYEAEEVYYTSGFKYKGVTYYKMSEIKNIMINE